MLHRHEMRVAALHSEEIAPMIARVIHFGPDDCHRLMVLRSAGYVVEICQSLVQLENRLQLGAAPDAVILSDSDRTCPQEAMAVARSFTSNPVILFRDTNMAYEDSGFDLIVPCLTAPEVWLQ